MMGLSIPIIIIIRNNYSSFTMLFKWVFYAAFLHEIFAMQKFTKQPSYTEVNPGHDTYLECKVFNKRGSCSWQKDNKPMGMYPNKYQWVQSNQANGDCSIWIRAAQLEFDDGNWECQVTASDFHTQDALTSLPVHLVVRVPPQRPRIEFNGTHILPGQNLTTLHGEVALIKCISHYGNPPPVLKWFLDQQEITPIKRQTNTTELDNPKTWLAVSVLELTISKENHGKLLTCVAVHESYPTKSSSIEVRLDVMFVPEIHLYGLPADDIEDLKDSVEINCSVKANPRAQVTWRKEGQSHPASLQETLKFSPAVREHSGLYSCQARNKAGDSEVKTVHIDVKYPPRINNIGRDRLKTAQIFSTVFFECIGEGNPPPRYRWIQRKTSSHSDGIVIRGEKSKFHINNVTYEDQGEWRCKVTNTINKEDRSAISEPIILQVHGAPQIIRNSTRREIFIESGQNVALSMIVCADPPPKNVTWEWGSSRLNQANEMGRFKADKILEEGGEDCFLATLHVKDTSSTDTRTYYLTVDNGKGRDIHTIQLYVNEPLQMSTLVSVAGALLVGFLIMICVCIYAIRAEKCCFSRKGDFKPSDLSLDGQKVDMEKSNNTNSQQINAFGPGGIPADAIYTTGPGGVPHRGGGGGTINHPDAMKHHFEECFQHFPQRNSSTSTIKTLPYPSHHQNFLQEPRSHQRYFSFNKYEFSHNNDDDDKNWSYAPTMLIGSYHPDNNKKSMKYSKKTGDLSRNKNFFKGTTLGDGPGGSSNKKKIRARPRPLQLENEEYYNVIFPQQIIEPTVKINEDFSPYFYQPDTFNHTIL